MENHQIRWTSKQQAAKGARTNITHMSTSLFLQISVVGQAQLEGTWSHLEAEA